MSHHLTRSQLIMGITRNLKEFGYTNLTQEFVANQVEAILDRGERPESIIAQFAVTMLKEAGFIEETE